MSETAVELQEFNLPNNHSEKEQTIEYTEDNYFGNIRVQQDDPHAED